MKLSNSNYKELLPKGLISKAAKCSVRECDKVGNDQFQAYVDENKESFDVNITLDGNGLVIHHDCDCKVKSAFCQHKVALLAFVAGSKKEPRSVVRSKKPDRIEALLNEISADDLKSWLRDLLTKNKDLELSFIHQFSGGAQTQTPKEVKRITLEAVKAVIKNRKKAETAEAKKIADLWTEMHQPFVDRFCSDLANEDAFLNFTALIDAGEEVCATISMSGNRLNKYLDSQLSKVVAAFNAMEKDDVWQSALAHFVQLINSDTRNVRVKYLLLLVNTLNAPDNTQANHLVDVLMKGFIASDLRRIYNSSAYCIALFRIVVDNGLFGKYYQDFKPIIYSNDYNVSLITLLIESGHFRLAEKYCEELIKSNSKEEYDIPYWQLLKRIYTIDRNEKKLMDVLMASFPITYDFDDYLFISARIRNEEEKKQWRTKVLTRARHSRANIAAITFAFKLADAEGRYKKMIEYIDNYTPYEMIAEYAEKMILTDKMEFLKAIVYNTALRYMVHEEETNSAISILVNLFNKYLTETELDLLVNSQFRGTYTSDLIRFAQTLKARKSGLK